MRVQFRVLAVSALLVFAGSALAAQPQAQKDLTPQQTRMKTCNTQATGKTGDDRKAFMSSCLKGEQPAKMTQQDKMKACNADPKAKTLKGDERKAFMSSCLKG
jgi:psiF repeat.